MLKAHHKFDSNRNDHKMGAKVGIIGAGAAGLVSAKIMRDHGFDVVVYEKSDHVGGVWKYSPNCIMYDSMRTNLPKEIMSFDEDNIFQSLAPDTVIPSDDVSFVGHRDVQHYLETYCEKYHIQEMIQFGKEVVQLQQLPSSSENTCSRRSWEISHRSILSSSSSSSDISHDHVDIVMICNGHFAEPYLPITSTPGLADFVPKHKIYHSIDYDRLLREGYFHNKRVLLLGAKSSGTDMARELSRGVLVNTPQQYTLNSHIDSSSSVHNYSTNDVHMFLQKAAIVYASDRNFHRIDSSILTATSAPMNDNDNIDNHDTILKNDEIPANLHLLSGLYACSAEGILSFEDNELLLSVHHDIDMILFCTGYLYQFPFIHSKSELETSIFPPIVSPNSTKHSIIEHDMLQSAMSGSKSTHSDIGDNTNNNFNLYAQLWEREICKEAQNPLLRYKKVRSLYQQLLWIDPASGTYDHGNQISTLGFIGLPFNIVPFPLFRIQALYLAKLWSTVFRKNNVNANNTFSNNNTTNDNFANNNSRMSTNGDTCKNSIASKIVDEIIDENTAAFACVPTYENQRECLANFEENLIASNRFTDKYHFLGGALQWQYLQETLLPVIECIESATGNHSADSSNESKNNTDPDTQAVLKQLQKRRRAFVTMVQEIYENSIVYRPAFTGAEDSYRCRNFALPFYSKSDNEFVWTVSS